jgi:hypothetical protein
VGLSRPKTTGLLIAAVIGALLILAGSFILSFRELSRFRSYQVNRHGCFRFSGSRCARSLPCALL